MTPTVAADPDRLKAPAERFEYLRLAQLRESPLNPRKTFDGPKLEELMHSIREKGVIEPIVVRPFPGDPRGLAGDEPYYEIIAGARRFRAAALAPLLELPAIVRHYTDAQAIEIMTIENSQRDDVPPLEEAAGYKQLLLVDQTYTLARLAGKIGRSEKYVADRLRLLELVPDIRELLVSGEIGVEHAEIIAKLKPADQRALLKNRGYQGDCGLFHFDGALEFETDPTRTKKRKVVSVRELRRWIAEHVRLDVAHAARTAPLDYGETKQKVDEALAQPGRGKKVIPITFSHYCPDGAKSDDERTYGCTAWKKAVGKDGQPTCDYAVLGVVVAGEHYGESFHVCINRDRCVTHWKDSVQAKQKAEKLRESGKGQQAAKVEKKAEQKHEDRWKREERERKAREAAWKVVEPEVHAELIAQALATKTLTRQRAEAIADGDRGVFDVPLCKKHLGANWFEKPVQALLVTAVGTWQFWGYDKKDWWTDLLEDVVKPYGLNLGRLQAIRDKHQPTPDATAAPAKAKGKKAKAAA